MKRENYETVKAIQKRLEVLEDTQKAVADSKLKDMQHRGYLSVVTHADKLQDRYFLMTDEMTIVLYSIIETKLSETIKKLVDELETL